jgi:mono/diheme cytochrome c family protein
MRLFKQLVVLGLVAFAFFGTLALFSMDVIKIEWIGFMEIQPAFDAQEDPLPVPARSIPLDGPVSIPNMGAPENPVPVDDVSVSRGETLYAINCAMCHGVTGEGNGQIAALLANKPADLTLDVTQSKSDGALFLTLTNGVTDRMPSLIENLTIRDRWDVVNYIRTLAATQQ